jgi:hypothetical protein
MTLPFLFEFLKSKYNCSAMIDNECGLSKKCFRMRMRQSMLFCTNNTKNFLGGLCPSGDGDILLHTSPPVDPHSKILGTPLPLVVRSVDDRRRSHV